MKTAVAAVCVVAAGMGGFKAYNTANQSQADMLLAENVEALMAMSMKIVFCIGVIGVVERVFMHVVIYEVVVV